MLRAKIISLYCHVVGYISKWQKMIASHQELKKFQVSYEFWMREQLGEK